MPLTIILLAFLLVAPSAMSAEPIKIANIEALSGAFEQFGNQSRVGFELGMQYATNGSMKLLGRPVEIIVKDSQIKPAVGKQLLTEAYKDDKVDLAAALRTLVSGTPEPRIHLDLPSELALTDPLRAQVLLRCTQEMITNSVRHAQADNLWISLTHDQQGLALTGRDDGRGVDEVQAGNGLTGMAERLAQLGGKLQIDTKPGAGFMLRAWMPLEEAT